MLQKNPTEAPIQLVTSTVTLTIAPGETVNVPPEVAREVRKNAAGAALLDLLQPVDAAALERDAAEAADAKKRAVDASAKAEAERVKAEQRAEAERAEAAAAAAAEKKKLEDENAQLRAKLAEIQKKSKEKDPT